MYKDLFFLRGKPRSKWNTESAIKQNINKKFYIIIRNSCLAKDSINKVNN